MLSAVVGAIGVLLSKMAYTGHRTSTDSSRFELGLITHWSEDLYIVLAFSLEE